MSDPVIRTEGLTKRYGGGLVAVDGVDLRVDQGDLFGFLGPNGSGKTTTVRMLLGLVFATSGRIEVLGRPMPRAAAAVLPGVGRRPVKAYSSGMRQRLGLAAALLRAPRLLVLDEPTNGLDPKGMREVRDLLAELVRAGATTVFLSSHLLAEVEQVCTRAAIVHQGRLVAQDRVEALLAPTGRVTVASPDLARAAELATGLPGVRLDGRRADRLTVRLDGTVPEDLNRQLVAGGVRVRELLVERPSLEDVFLRLTAGPGRHAPG
jgi:ABC-2 type transport system ATP-binding protein